MRRRLAYGQVSVGTAVLVVVIVLVVLLVAGSCDALHFWDGEKHD